MESAIAGNNVQFKCNIQSYVADFVQVVAWVDSEGSSFMLDQKYGNFLLDSINYHTYTACSYRLLIITNKRRKI